MRHYTRLIIAPICGLALMGAGTASGAIVAGDSIGIDYGSADGTVANWNTKSTTAATADESVLDFDNLVRLSDGAATGVSLSWDALLDVGVAGSTAGAENDPAFFPPEVSGDVAFIVRRAVMTFSGLDDSLKYNITFLSAIGGTANRPDVNWGWTTSTIDISEDAADWDTTWVFENLNAKSDRVAHTFANLQPSGGILRITLATVPESSDAILLNGVQLDAVPEPASLALIGLAGLMLSRRGKRQ